jgi:hypothetical protein
MPARTARSWSAKILEKDAYAYGFDAQAGEYGNLISKGIIDPTKVVRAALQGAASVAGLLITTEAMGRRAAEEAEPGHARRARGRHGRHGLLTVYNDEGSGTPGPSWKADTRSCRCGESHSTMRWHMWVVRVARGAHPPGWGLPSQRSSQTVPLKLCAIVDIQTAWRCFDAEDHGSPQIGARGGMGA